MDKIKEILVIHLKENNWQKMFKMYKSFSKSLNKMLRFERITFCIILQLSKKLYLKNGL